MVQFAHLKNLSFQSVILPHSFLTLHEFFVAADQLADNLHVSDFEASVCYFHLQNLPFLCRLAFMLMSCKQRDRPSLHAHELQAA